MKAIVQESYGSPDGLVLREIDRPVVGDDGVLVKVHAAGVNAYISSLDAKSLPPEFQILQYKPRPWTPADSLLVTKLFAEALSTTWRLDLMREALAISERLENVDYGFRMVVGVSGTCYVADEYFTDVVHRYSLRQAIEERFVKTVEYVDELPPAAEKPGMSPFGDFSRGEAAVRALGLTGRWVLSGKAHLAKYELCKKRAPHESNRDAQERADQEIFRKTLGFEFRIAGDGFCGED
jgi:hypothetical protein